MLTRRASIDIDYEGVNISKEIADDLEGFTYTDNASGVADDISITLNDKNKKWLSTWAPLEGDTVKAKILTTNWKKYGDSQVLDCGTFIVDEPSYSGRPIIAIINAISFPANKDFKDTPKSRTWENATIENIAATIAENAGIELFYDSSINQTIDYVEQSETSDSAFLLDLCKKNSLAVKIYSNKLVMFSEMEYEQKISIATIDENDCEPNWTAKKTLTDSGYTGCKIEYTDPLTKETFSYLYELPNIAGPKKIFKLNEVVYSYAEAERLAKSTLRELNKKQTTLSLTIIGNVNLIASSCVDIVGFGRFDGKYYIDKANHSIPDFKTSIEIRKVLEGY